MSIGKTPKWTATPTDGLQINSMPSPMVITPDGTVAFGGSDDGTLWYW